MFEFIAILFAIVAAFYAILATMRASAHYDNMDRHDINNYNFKEIWFLIWDHREEYLPVVGCLIVVLVSVMLA